MATTGQRTRGGLRRGAASRAARRAGADRRLAVRLALAAVAAAVVAVPATVLLLLVESRWEPLERFDLGVADALTDSVRGTAMAGVLRVGSVVTDPFVVRVVVAAVVVWLWRRGAHRLAVWAGVTTVAGGVVGVLAKLAVERARPMMDDPIYVTGGYSFPSGHALNSMLGAAVLLLVFGPVLRGRRRVLAWAAAAAFVLFTGFDRVGLGVHYVSDVVAGWFVALAVVAATATAFEVWRRGEGRPPSPPGEVEPEAAGRLQEPRDGRAGTG